MFLPGFNSLGMHVTSLTVPCLSPRVPKDLRPSRRDHRRERGIVLPGVDEGCCPGTG